MAMGHMATFQVKTETDIISRRAALERKLQKQHEVMRDCDAWHNMDADTLRPTIWRNVAENVKRHTVISPVPMAVKNTCVAFTASRQPKITAIAVNTLSADQLRAANFSERLGYAILHTLNRYRQQMLETETAEMGYGRAVMIAKACWLTPELRGEKHRERPIQNMIPFTTITPGPGEYQNPDEPDVLYEVEEHGDFPVLVQLYDPLDCLWSIGRDGGTREFMHISSMTWDEVVDLYPDITRKEAFRGRTDVAHMDVDVEVIDYWDETHNAILVDGTFYKKPMRHEYPYCPIIIELANVGPIRTRTDLGSRKQLVARPVTWGILPAAANQSWSDSMNGTYIQAGVFQSYKHMRIDPENSPHMQVKGDGEEPEYVGDFDLGPDHIVPLFNDEDFKPIEQAQVNNQLAMFQQTMDSHMAMSGFSTSILTGQATVPGANSGYQTVQERISTSAKMKTTVVAMDRFMSRLFTLIKDLIVWEWEHDDVALMLSEMVGESARAREAYVEISKETFAAVREIRVNIIPEVPMNDESETTKIFQAQGQFLLSDYHAIDALGFVDDPEEEMKRIAAERVAKEDPIFGPPIRLAMAADWYVMNGMEEQGDLIRQAATFMAQQALGQLTAAAQPQQPSPNPLPPGGMAPSAMPPPGVDPMAAAMGGGMPMDPSMLGDPAMLGMDPSMMGGMPPMDPAMMQQMMAGMPPDQMMNGGGQAPIDPAMLEMLMQQGLI